MGKTTSAERKRKQRLNKAKRDEERKKDAEAKKTKRLDENYKKWELSKISEAKREKRKKMTEEEKKELARQRRIQRGLARAKKIQAKKKALQNKCTPRFASKQQFQDQTQNPQQLSMPEVFADEEQPKMFIEKEDTQFNAPIVNNSAQQQNPIANDMPAIIQPPGTSGNFPRINPPPNNRWFSKACQIYTVLADSAAFEQFNDRSSLTPLWTGTICKDCKQLEPPIREFRPSAFEQYRAMINGNFRDMLDDTLKFLDPIMKLLTNPHTSLVGSEHLFNKAYEHASLLDKLKNEEFHYSIRPLAIRLPSTERFRTIICEKVENSAISMTADNFRPNDGDEFMNFKILAEFDKKNNIEDDLVTKLTDNESVIDFYENQKYETDDISMKQAMAYSKYLKKHKSISFKLKKPVDCIETYLKTVCPQAISSNYNKRSGLFEFKITGHITQTIDSICTKTLKNFCSELDPTTITRVVIPNDSEIVSTISAKNELLKTVYTSVKKLADLGCVSPSSAKEAIMNLWKDPEDIEKFREVLAKLKNKIKNFRGSCKNTFDSVSFFRSENMLKTKIEFENNEIFVYYSHAVLKYVIDNEFDQLFLDGTHLNVNNQKNQMLLFRLYSSKKSEILTAAYVICSSKKTETYELIIKILYKAGFFKNLRIVMTDFELAFKNAFQNVQKVGLSFRFCYLHFLKSLKATVKSINKASTLQLETVQGFEMSTEPEKLSENLAIFFSFIIFIPADQLVDGFYLWTAIAQSVFGNTDELAVFCCSFLKNFIVGHFSDHFSIDIGISDHITNNFVEGANSGFKRFTKSYLSEETTANWISYDAKKTILGLGSIKVSDMKATDNYFKLFADFVKEGNLQAALCKVIEKIASMGNHSKKKESKIRTNDCLLLQQITISSLKVFTFSGKTIAVSAQSVVKKMKDVKKSYLMKLKCYK